ncbi:hypothetical protein ACFV9E_14850 [Streptomyces sp. NPDC059835]|uniref:DNA polymerase Y family protein n=1 Tax=Streptomyces sp. NPDC059835 TaxID=3346967 RepID=UPI003668DE80
MTPPRQILHAHFSLPPGAGSQGYEQLLTLAADITPHVQPLPPDAAHLDITGALRYWDRGAKGICDLLRIRALALLGAEVTCAVAPNRMLASMAADTTPPGAATVLADRDVAAWLRPRPVAALYGVGPKTAATLTKHGLHTIADLADAPLPALTRLFGTATGRALHLHARGDDTRPVEPQPLPRSISVDHTFTADCLDPDEHRRAVLALAHRLGAQLRDAHQAAGALTLTIRYADRTQTTRTRTLPAPTQHTRLLVACAYDLVHLLGLQRARVRAIALRAEALISGAEAATQLSFDPAAERAEVVEAATDRVRARFGPNAVKPAALAAGSR